MLPSGMRRRSQSSLNCSHESPTMVILWNNKLELRCSDSSFSQLGTVEIGRKDDHTASGFVVFKTGFRYVKIIFRLSSSRSLAAVLIDYS